MKTNQIISLICAFVLLAVSSCKKNEYPPSTTDNDPVYYTEMTVDGQKIRIEAGSNDYYNYSAVQQDSGGLINYSAELKKLNCSDCPLSIAFQINNFAPNKDFVVDSSLSIQKYDYLKPQTVPEFKMIFKGQLSGSTAGAVYFWDFGNGQTATGDEVTHNFNSTNKTSVCLKVVNSNACSSTICNEINPSKDGLNASVSAISNGTRSASFSASVFGGKKPFQYNWNFGDGIVSTASITAHTFPYVGSYGVTLKVTDSLGKTTTAKYNYKTLSDLSSCAANFAISSTTLIPASYNSKVKIVWRDGTGQEFRSNSIDQGADSNFEVLSIDEAGLNEKGEKTKKVKIKFNVLVHNGSKTIKIENAQAVIAIAYK